MNYELSIVNWNLGELAQLARATALQAVGQRFDSVILHLFPKQGERSLTWLKIKQSNIVKRALLIDNEKLTIDNEQTESWM